MEAAEGRTGRLLINIASASATQLRGSRTLPVREELKVALVIIYQLETAMGIRELHCRERVYWKRSEKQRKVRQKTSTATKVFEPATRISSHHVSATPLSAQLQSS